MKRMMNNRMKKSKMVSWAPGYKFRQVKLFVSEDCPSKVGVEPDDHLQLKTSWMHSSGRESDDLPPGFEDSHCVNDLREQLTHIPRIKWKCPTKFITNHNWVVAAGEESEEAEAQRHRETRVLEAMYPRISATPPSPYVSLDVEKEYYDDSQTPLIPITPIEEEEEPVDISSNLTAPVDTSISSQPSEKPVIVGLSNDAVIATAATLNIMMKNMEQRSMIDTDLLVKILNDPKMVEKLINDNRARAKNGSAPTPFEVVSAPASTKTVNAPGKAVSAPAKAVSAPIFAPKLATGSIHLPYLKPAMVSSPILANRNSCHVSNEVQPTLIMTPPRPDIIPVKRSVPLSSPQTNMFFAPRPANGNLLPVINQVQPTLFMMRALQNSAPMVRPTEFPNVHAQPNLASKVSLQLRPNYFPISSLAANPMKDANYIKQLIREHGGEYQQDHDHRISQSGNHDNHLKNLKLVQNLKPGELKPKYQKSCIYFKSAKGCRNGANCPFVHDDMSFQFDTDSMVEAPSVKRIKLGGEIAKRS